LDIFWWVIAIVAVILLITFIVIRTSRNRKAAQKREDNSVILNLYNRMSNHDIKVYKDLPNRDARVEWLKNNYPEFVAASERLHEDNLLGVIAVYLDFRILRGVTAYSSRDRALSGYQYASYNISLNEHQEKLDVFNAEQERLAKIEAEHAAKLRAERAAEEKSRKEAAKVHWDSLSEEEKTAFKNASGKTNRQQALGSVISSDYSVDVLYPVIMATEFSGINGNTSSSIDYCQSSSYSDSGSHSSYGGHFDGGSSYSDGGSSSCDGGGGGGGD
jgi:uncharacterized membrane protein YgcG